jgi:hypothetical protein
MVACGNRQLRASAMAARAPGRGHHAVGQPHGQGLGRLHLAPGQDQVHGMAHAHQARQAHGAAVNQRHAKAAAVHAEVGVLLHHPQVTPQRQLHAAGHGGAADRRDHRLGQQQA